MEKPVIRISVRNLVEFILRNGDLESGGTAGDKEAMLKGSRLHRKIHTVSDHLFWMLSFLGRQLHSDCQAGSIQCVPVFYRRFYIKMYLPWFLSFVSHNEY